MSFTRITIVVATIWFEASAITGIVISGSSDKDLADQFKNGESAIINTDEGGSTTDDTGALESGAAPLTDEPAATTDETDTENQPPKSQRLPSLPLSEEPAPESTEESSTSEASSTESALRQSLLLKPREPGVIFNLSRISS
ncbi:MAG: hypothetical protein R3C11_21820 [Planctomycetaceae bacterium]